MDRHAIRDLLIILVYGSILGILASADRPSRLWDIGLWAGLFVIAVMSAFAIRSFVNARRAARVRQPAGLISVLLDQSASAEDRDDAAASLTDFDEPEALAALITAANDTGDDGLLDSCAESIVDIWERNGVWAENEFSKFNARAQAVVRRQFIDPESPSPPTFTEIR